jgi:arylsulfatase
VNELHGLRYGKWKLYFPHNYRTMEGQQPGKDGVPGDYVYIDIKEIELYDLSVDLGEKENLAGEYPEIVEKIEQLADNMRNKLGDSLREMEGTENRPAGTTE